jgi:Transposase DDE domain
VGCFSMNFLVLSVVHQGIAFPIFGLFLPKQGNSNTPERLHLLKQFLDVFGAHRIDCLLADREFIGEKWFASLPQHRIRFRIRIKRDMKIAQANGRFSPAQNFFRSLPRATSCAFIGSRGVCGHCLYVTGMRLPAGEYGIIVSNDESDSILEDYKKRWKIEVLFQALTSRGFNVEATHLKDEERLKTLFSVLTIAFCWSYHVGAWRHVVKRSGLKTTL